MGNDKELWSWSIPPPPIKFGQYALHVDIKLYEKSKFKVLVGWSHELAKQ